MSNSILTPTAVTREALRVLHQKLSFTGNVVRDYDSSFAKSGAKIGDTLKIRLPNQYKVRTGTVMQAQDTVEESVELKVTNTTGVDVNFTDADLTLSLDDFSDRIIEPAVSVIAANIEATCLTTAYQAVANQVNNHGSAATFAKFTRARKLLVDNLAPTDQRYVQLNSQDNADMVDALKGLFNPQDGLNTQYREGRLGRTAGFDFYENTLIPDHSRGAADTAYTTSTQTGAMPVSTTPISQITVASGTGALPVGEVFTIANVYAVHPETKAQRRYLQQFVVTETYSGGAGTLKFSPSIITDGAKKNVSIASTSATASISVAGQASTTHGISLAYQKTAFAFATADLVMPKGVDMAAREVMDGISMRLVRQFDIVNGKFPARLDVLWGFKTLRPQLAARIANS